MKIAIEKPPIWDLVINAGLAPTITTVFAYGDTIYNPSGMFIREDTIVHEKTHCRQQGNNPDAWWERYVQDGYFRINQEVEAYANQYSYICRNLVKDRNQRNIILNDFARHLSGPIYGKMIGQGDAYAMISKKANV